MLPVSFISKKDMLFNSLGNPSTFPDGKNRIVSETEFPSRPEGNTPFGLVTVEGYERARNQRRRLNASVLYSSLRVIVVLAALRSSAKNLRYQ